MNLRTALKNFERRFIRPVVRLFRPARQRVEVSTGHNEAWLQLAPALLNAVGSVAAYGHELVRLRREDIEPLWTDIKKVRSEDIESLRTDINKLRSDDLHQLRRDLERNVADLWQRVEFVRKETMYEFKYGTSASRTASARIVSPDKVQQARDSGLKLNLGCGHVPRDGYINVDQRDLPGVDVVADAGHLPFDESSVQEISSSHVLEHFPQQQLRRLLAYWNGLLQPQGTFRAIVPDGEAMLAGIADGSYPFEQFREVLFGSQEYEGDFHFNLLTPESLSTMLEEAGFREITVPVKARKNDICFEFEIVASK